MNLEQRVILVVVKEAWKLCTYMYVLYICIEPLQ